MSRQAARQAQALEFSAVDRGRPFFPERLTQLYHTPFYTELTQQQRLTYNQLVGVSSNEHFMLFESGFTNRVISKLVRHPLVAGDAELQQCLRFMLREEARHFAMFRDLNRHVMPEIYVEDAYRFTRMSAVMRAMLWVLTSVPQHLICLIWLVLIMEEHSNHISRRMLSRSGSGSLGPLEANFVEIHRLHLRDESRHVHIDARLLDLYIDRAGRIKRSVNALALKTLLLEILAPKHAGIEVVRELVRRHPELEPSASAMQAAVRGLKIDPAFALTLSQTAQSPLSSLLQDNYPEFFIPRAQAEIETHE